MRQVATAFLVSQAPEGHWEVTSDLSLAAEMDVHHHPIKSEIRLGCSEIERAISQQELAFLVSSSIKANSNYDSEHVSARMRDAINRKKPTSN
jgi:hypothetical protein